jgi:hypothetical protein
MGRLSVINRIMTAAVILIAALVIDLGTAGAAGSSRAGLIVAHGDGRVAYALVTFDGDSISGADLVERSGLSVTEVNFGGLGVAVCSIDATGCDIGECRKRLCQGPKRDDPYWQYFIKSGSGSWQVAALGISGDSVPDGGVRALIWSAGTPQFPAPSIDDLAAKSGPVGEGGVALTRYQSDGSVDTGGESESNDGTPFAGFAVVGVAVVIVGGVVLRRRRSGRSRR